MKRWIKVLIGIFISLLVITIIIFLGFKVYDHIFFKYDTLHDGDTLEQQQYYPDNEAYELALNSKNLIAFKYPDRALKQLKKDCKNAIDEIQKEFNIKFTLSKYNYDIYETYSWQLDTDDEKIIKHALFLNNALDTYRHSFISQK